MWRGACCSIVTPLNLVIVTLIFSIVTLKKILEKTLVITAIILTIPDAFTKPVIKYLKEKKRSVYLGIQELPR